MTTLAELPVTTPKTAEEQRLLAFLDDPKSAATLPSMRSVLDELETLTQGGKLPLDEITRVVELDQGMSLLIMRIANSVYFAPKNPILEVGDAIMYIGMAGFRDAVLSMRCMQRTEHIKQTVLNWREFWVHAAGVGHLTRELSTHLKSRPLAPESYYLMGLLHDVGKVVVAHVMPEEFDRVYLQATEEKKSPAEMEPVMLGIDHAHLGALYLERQSIAPALYEPVRYHHCEAIENADNLKHSLLIRLADRLALHYSLGDSGNRADLGDPFASADWKWYLEIARTTRAGGHDLEERILESVSRVSDLARKLFA